MLILSIYSNEYSQTIEPDTALIKSAKQVGPKNPSIPLIEYIRRLPGVVVMNQGGVTRLMPRGSRLGDNDPLFVVDGRYISTYTQLENTVEVNDIKS